MLANHTKTDEVYSPNGKVHKKLYVTIYRIEPFAKSILHPTRSPYIAIIASPSAIKGTYLALDLTQVKRNEITPSTMTFIL